MNMLKDAKRILVISLRYIGDTIWMYPFLRNLKLNFPDAEISALINEGGEIFLKLLPEVSEVIPVRRNAIKGRHGVIKFIHLLAKIRRKKFDTVFVLTNSDRPTIIALASGAKRRIGFRAGSRWRAALLTERLKWDLSDAENYPHLIEQHLRALTGSGLDVYDTSLTIDVPESEITKIVEKFPLLRRKDRKAVVVHPGARTELRQWGAGNFAQVINALEEDHSIFLIGGPDERGVVQDILKRLKKPPEIVSNDLSLLEFAALCKFGDLFIGNDSAPIHIAAATGLLVIGIYGPTMSKYCRPWTDRCILFDISMLPCRLCDQDVCASAERQACLKVITPEMVTGKALEALSGQTRLIRHSDMEE